MFKKREKGAGKRIVTESRVKPGENGAMRDKRGGPVDMSVMRVKFCCVEGVR